MFTFLPVEVILPMNQAILAWPEPREPHMTRFIEKIMATFYDLYQADAFLQSQPVALTVRCTWRENADDTVGIFGARPAYFPEDTYNTIMHHVSMHIRSALEPLAEYVSDVRDEGSLARRLDSLPLTQFLN